MLTITKSKLKIRKFKHILLYEEHITYVLRMIKSAESL